MSETSRAVRGLRRKVVMWELPEGAVVFKGFLR